MCNAKCASGWVRCCFVTTFATRASPHSTEAHRRSAYPGAGAGLYCDSALPSKSMRAGVEISSASGWRRRTDALEQELLHWRWTTAGTSALQACRFFQLIHAVRIAAELGDLSPLSPSRAADGY